MKKKIVTIAALLALSITLQAQLRFQKTYGGGGNEEAYAVDTTSDGGYIIGGYTSSSGNGGKDAYVLKTDVADNIQWSKTFGGPQDDDVVTIHQTFDGGYIMGGYLNNKNKFFISKMNSTGSILFTKVHSAFNNSVHIIQTKDSNYLAVATVGSIPFYTVEYAKFDNNGDTLGQKSFGYAFGGDVAELPNGELIITAGSGVYGDSLNDIVLTKTSSTGAILWSEQIQKSLNDAVYHITILPSGHFFLAGSTWSSPIGMMDIICID